MPLLFDDQCRGLSTADAEACEATEPFTWQIRSCSLAETAAALEEIRKEGERYDTDDIHVR